MTTHVYTLKCPSCGYGSEVHVNAPNATFETEKRLRERAKCEICSKCGIVMDLDKMVERTSDYELAYNMLVGNKGFRIS